MKVIITNLKSQSSVFKILHLSIHRSKPQILNCCHKHKLQRFGSKMTEQLVVNQNSWEFNYFLIGNQLITQSYQPGSEALVETL